MLSIPGTEGHFLHFLSCWEGFPQTSFTGVAHLPRDMLGLNGGVLHQPCTSPSCTFLRRALAPALPMKSHLRGGFVLKGHCLANACIKNPNRHRGRLRAPGKPLEDGQVPELRPPGDLLGRPLRRAAEENLPAGGLGFPSSLQRAGGF